MKKLAEGLFQSEIENAVSKQLGKIWSASGIKTNEVGAMHDAAYFIGDEYKVFVKLGDNSFSVDQFTQEAIGLKLLTEKSGIRTPMVIDMLNIDGIALLILEAIEIKPVDNDRAWDTLGRGLAQIHKAEWTHCGLETHSYLGIFHQDNTPIASWPEFYGEFRLRPQMEMAVDKGMMTIEDCKPIEKLISRLPVICGPEQPFSLLHGDPWPGNLLYDGKEMIAIDCSLYYGNREIDISTVDFFYSVPKRMFDAYHEVYPIDPGYEGRKNLWRVNQWLGHVTLFGEKYIPKLMNAVRPYL